MTVSASNVALVPMRPAPLVHPLIVRLTHWINAAAIIVMIMSGLEIHNAYPTLPFKVPEIVTLGGWLGGATQWHFAAMWVLMTSGSIYVAHGLLSGRFRRKLWPISPRAVITDMVAAFSGRLSHQDLSVYNAVQRLLYSGVILAGFAAVLSGLAIWKPVQFRLLCSLFGDFDQARLIHFMAMSAVLSFLIVHVVMALLVPRSLLAMVRGR
ncbi:MAG TPA: cytochrome b/b6 domain-containing protein [Beijerinckia sp.]|nr:cytochrome b/b6 domain-containing protein [Beijerinckia sp.]